MGWLTRPGKAKGIIAQVARCEAVPSIEANAVPGAAPAESGSGSDQLMMLGDYCWPSAMLVCAS